MCSGFFHRVKGACESLGRSCSKTRAGIGIIDLAWVARVLGIREDLTTTGSGQVENRATKQEPFSSFLLKFIVWYFLYYIDYIFVNNE